MRPPLGVRVEVDRFPKFPFFIERKLTAAVRHQRLVKHVAAHLLIVAVGSTFVFNKVKETLATWFTD